MVTKNNKEKIVAVSGGFDPIHIGHMRMFREAKKHGKKLVVILNNDNWLRTKKGFVFMPQDERKEMLLGLGTVDKVVITAHKPFDEDRSVCRELAAIEPDVFCNGGDRIATNTPEVDLCKKLGIKMVWGIGKGGKIQSSSWLTGNLMKDQKVETRPWGRFQMLAQDPAGKWWVKLITVMPGKRTSLQSHAHRDELWQLIEGEMTGEVGGSERNLKYGDAKVGKGVIHRLSSKEGGTIVEVAMGDDVREDDIKRYEDDHGRV